jgi:hypothetical protein
MDVLGTPYDVPRYQPRQHISHPSPDLNDSNRCTGHVRSKCAQDMLIQSTIVDRLLG